MKKTQVYYLFLFLFFLSGKVAGQVSEREPLRNFASNDPSEDRLYLGRDKQALHPDSVCTIFSYNILDGFEQQQDSSRRERFVRFMRRERPDVVALNELVGFTEKDLQALAESYGHPYVAIVKEEGYPVGLTSKHPIAVVNKQVEGFWHGMLHARTAGLDLIVTHLSPFDWKFRRKEAEAIVRYVETNKLDSCLVMGDMNAYSPFDAGEVETHDALKKNMQRWDKAHPEYGNLRENHFDYSVLSQFLAAGFTDILARYVPAARRMSYPTAWSYQWAWGDKRLLDYQERLDFILVSPALVSRCTGAHVHNGADTDTISDHYPVSVEIRLP